ncbi:hypothetical protein CW306_09875 [Bacillus sp. BA3]|nr:hypothetical protein CW306_09875 [Bacillus sp. BA3]
MERKVRDSCGKSASKGDPTGAKRRGVSRTARGKRVPGVEIHYKYPLSETPSLSADCLPSIDN